MLSFSFTIKYWPKFQQSFRLFAIHNFVIIPLKITNSKGFGISTFGYQLKVNGSVYRYFGTTESGDPLENALADRVVGILKEE